MLPAQGAAELSTIVLDDQRPVGGLAGIVGAYHVPLTYHGVISGPRGHRCGQQDCQKQN